MKNTVFISLLMTLTTPIWGQCLSYPSGCLEMKLMFVTDKLVMDSVKVMQFDSNEFQELFTKSTSELNLEIVFYNNCNLNISVPENVDIDMPNDLTFWIEAVKIDSNRIKKLENYYEYDYQKISKCMTVKSNQIKLLSFKHPFGVYSSGKGEYRFRIVMNSAYCNLSSKNWDYYYSNWIKLNAE